ncbi:MAG TPA: hypothetical protein VH189_14200 [Rhizomicrobium sp.]|nr:hypothetical protein [Rhizomicrobium sp.]
MTRTLERTATAVAALLLQLIFVLLFAHFLLTPHAQKERAREMLLLLRPLARLPAERPPVRRTVPRATTSLPPPLTAPPLPNPGITGVAPGPISPLEAIGRALSGCTPEAMAQLSPQDRAKCPPLALAPKPDQDLVEQPRSHAKDEALWTEEKAERDWAPNCAGADQVAKCMMHQSMAEQQRAQAARARISEERWRRNQPPPMPKRLGPP